MDFIITIIFFLLRDKSQASYKRAFMELRNQCLKSVETFEPKLCYVDFEKSIHNALREVWPQIEVKGCVISFMSILVAQNYFINDLIDK